jgi:hypothetical protein
MKARLHVRPIAVLLAAAVVAVAAFSTSASGAGGPAISSPPTISGTARSGDTLTAAPGTWATPPTSVAYAWQRCSDTGSSCAAISGAAGATATTYVLTSADVGQTVRVVETATDGGGTTDSPSAPSAVVVSGAAPQNSVPPTISGTTTEGQTLVGADGTWAGATPITFTYAWSRCDATGAACAAITGATSKTYVLVAADNDKTLRLSVTARNTPGSQTQTSAPTAVIAAAAPASVVTLPSGGRSIDASDVKSPSAQLIIDQVAFSPNPLRSRAAFKASIHVSDTRGFSVRNALVFVEGLPFGRSSTPPEVKTGSDGTATLTLVPTHKLPLQNGATLVMFVRARVAGDRLIAGTSARRLVNLRVVPS